MRVLAALALGLIALAFAWFEWAFLAVCAGAVIAVTQLRLRVSKRVHSRARPE